MFIGNFRIEYDIIFRSALKIGRYRKFMQEIVKILHLDDSHFSLKLTKRLLQNFADVMSANTVEIALDHLTKHKFDLILTDYYLGDHNGLDFIRNIREFPEFEFLPVLIYSANSGNRMSFRAIRLGANKCVPKIIPIEELKQIIRNQIKAPYSDYVKLVYHEHRTFGWTRDGRYFEYAPGFDYLVEGANKEDAFLKMERFLYDLPIQKFYTPADWIDDVGIRLHQLNFPSTEVEDSKNV
jgi:CheY-like chemotaxis protein